MRLRNSVSSVIGVIVVVLYGPSPATGNTGKTAGHLVSIADSLALTIAPDAGLISVNSPDVDTAGKAMSWNYVYASNNSLQEYHFHSQDHSVVYDSSKSLRFGVSPLDSNWIDSDVALNVAELEEGHTFRILYPKSNISAMLYKPMYPPFYNYWEIQYTGTNSSITIKINALNGEVVTSVEYSADGYHHPVVSKLLQNYPNPFNPSTTISYSVQKAGFVRLTICDLLGREIDVLVNERLEPGEYKSHWEPDRLASGTYLCRLQSDNSIESTKLLFLK